MYDFLFSRHPWKKKGITLQMFFFVILPLLSFMIMDHSQFSIRWLIFFSKVSAVRFVYYFIYCAEIKQRFNLIYTNIYIPLIYKTFTHFIDKTYLIIYVHMCTDTLKNGQNIDNRYIFWGT